MNITYNLETHFGKLELDWLNFYDQIHWIQLIIQ